MGDVTIAAGALVFLTIIAGVAAVFFIINPWRTAQDRLTDMTGTGPAPDARRAERMGTVGQTVARLAAPKEDSEEFNALRKRLIQCGYRGRNNVEMYSAVRFGMAVAFPLIFALFPIQTSMLGAVGGTLVTCAIGYWLPALWITNTLQKRQEAILRTFPDALDMLTASVEAGLGLDAAFRRVANEMTDAAPLLCDELKLVNNEVSAGIPRTDALKHLEVRTGLDEVASLVNVLIQAERFGTPVARSLRVHSELVRTKRMQKAEEQAAKISPKLTVAMILFMLPCLIIVVLGPAIVKVIRNLLPALG